MSQTNEERSQRTRERLLEATVSCLIEHGYAKTSTTEISKRAGLSRGAQLHHFPNKASLVTAAVEHLFHLRQREFATLVDELPEGTNKVEYAIEFLWKCITGPTFYAWLELAVASRTDETLKKSIAEIGRRLDEDVQNLASQVFDVPSALTSQARIFGLLVFSALEGMSASKMVLEDALPYTETLELLKSLATYAIHSASEES